MDKYHKLLFWIINNLLNESQLSVKAPGFGKAIRYISTYEAQSRVKHLEISIEGDTTDDLIAALHEVKRDVGRECIEGSNRNETGQYYFVIKERVCTENND